MQNISAIPPQAEDIADIRGVPPTLLAGAWDLGFISLILKNLTF